jgi:DNA primase
MSASTQRAQEGGGFDAAILDEIKSRLPLLSVVGKDVKLTKHGHGQKGCCPFHNEKSGSFYVYPDHYHCFGCGAHGDLITYVMKKKGGSFPETVKELASQAGVTLPEMSPARSAARVQTARIKAALKSASDFFIESLKRPEARDALAYLVSRGVTADDIQNFRLGWAPAGKDGLVKHLRDNGYTDNEILGASLARKSERGEELRDFFFGRIMFPIGNRHGDILSFGGRALGDVLPKYINGAETELYKKGRAIYGFDRAATAIRAQGRAILVEGNLDVVSMHRVGLTNTVAPMGTAVTPSQIEILWREAPDVVMCMDGDKAGINSTMKLCEKLLPNLTPSRRVYVALLTDGDDPDSLIAKGAFGVDAIKATIQTAAPIIDFMFEAIRSSSDLSSPGGRADFRSRIRDTVAAIKHPDLAAAWEEASIDFVSQSFSPTTVPGEIVLDQPVAEVLIGQVLVDPAILTRVEDLFAAMPVPPGLADLKRDIGQWWLTSDSKSKRSLIDHLKTSGMLELATTAAKAASAYCERVGPALDPAKVWSALLVSRMSRPVDDANQQVSRSPRLATTTTSDMSP